MKIVRQRAEVTLLPEVKARDINPRTVARLGGLLSYFCYVVS